MKRVGDFFLDLFSDGNGNVSSLRVLLFFLFGWFVWMFLEWRYALRVELLKPEPDYDGLTKLFIAIFVSFGLGLISKIVQKKYEKEKEY